MLNTLRKVEDHENHVRWIYLATVLNMGGGGKVRSMRENIVLPRTYQAETNILDISPPPPSKVDDTRSKTFCWNNS